jgi:hypothetical protein
VSSPNNGIVGFSAQSASARPLEALGYPFQCDPTRGQFFGSHRSTEHLAHLPEPLGALVFEQFPFAERLIGRIRQLGCARIQADRNVEVMSFPGKDRSSVNVECPARAPGLPDRYRLVLGPEARSDLALAVVGFEISRDTDAKRIDPAPADE